jgi:cyclomaltodextrin glucanotransferase
MVEVFAKPGSDFSSLLEALHLDDGVYRNPYELMSFYDNHDMARMNARPEGFIDANNWLFTARGIPVVYYGSEIAFMAGTKEHEGNRNYFGADNVARAKGHRIRARLADIARIRRDSPALQRGLQLNLELTGDRAAFLRVYQRGDVAETALVLLNKGEAPARFVIGCPLDAGDWRDVTGGETVAVRADVPLALEVPAHGVRVLLRAGRIGDPALRAELDRQMKALADGTGG